MADIPLISAAKIDIVSTHSPARGLTSYADKIGSSILFQLTAPQGG